MDDNHREDDMRAEGEIMEEEERMEHTRADVDYELWQKYLETCKKDKVKPSIRDYVVWLDEHDVDTTA